jgi:hypothetical protein
LENAEPQGSKRGRRGSTEQFAGEIEAQVEEICERLRAGTYRAQRTTRWTAKLAAEHDGAAGGDIVAESNKDGAMHWILFRNC